MDRARDAVRTVLAHLHARGDEAALYTFDSKLQEVVSFTTDLDRIRGAEPRRPAVGDDVAL